MRILGLDYGEKRIGVAVSDPLGFTAQGVVVITRSKDIGKDIAELKSIINKYGVEEIVMGLPITMKGEVGSSAKAVLEFVDKVKIALNLPIITWDERFSTAAAERVLIEADLSRAKRKKVIDKEAAVFMLQGYLDSKRKNDETVDR